MNNFDKIYGHKKQQVLNQIRSLDLTEKEQQRLAKLQDAQTEQEFIKGLVEFGTKAALAAGLAYTGNVPAAAVVFAPTAGQVMMGTGARTGTGEK